MNGAMIGRFVADCQCPTTAAPGLLAARGRPRLPPKPCHVWPAELREGYAVGILLRRPSIWRQQFEMVYRDFFAAA